MRNRNKAFDVRLGPRDGPGGEVHEHPADPDTDQGSGNHVARVVQALDTRA